ncbi:MAG TPA: ATP-binding protein [Nitriliruptorales bacterium]|nr:ATP-binding protein [Nitriliruptorales bacterium]
MGQDRRGRSGGTAAPPAGSGRLAALVRGVPAVLYTVTDEQWAPAFVNNRIEDLCGYGPQQWLAEPDLWLTRILPADRQRVVAARTESWRTGSPFGATYRLRHRSGEVLLVRDEAEWGWQEGQRVAHGVLLATEGQAPPVPEEVASEPGSRDAGRRSEPAVNPSFLSVLMHDLRSPLAAARWLVSSLLDSTPELPPPQRDELLQRAANNLARADDLVTDALAVQRLKGRTEPAATEPVEVGALIRQVAGRIDLDPPPALVRDGEHLVEAEPALLDGALERLLRNAAGHTPPGTQVWLRVESVDQGLLLSVDDDGPGVADELKEAIFAPFERGIAPSSRGGFGLGLAYVAQVARLHDGRAWVEDRPDGGASFRLLLPARRQAGETAPDEPRPSRPSRR